jgi:hypothetical protein
VQKLRESVGACRPEGNIRAENWLRGRFRLGCERGWVDVTVTLAPTNPPTIQHLELEEGHVLAPSLRTAIESTFGSPAGPGEATGLAATVDRQTLARQLAALASAYGKCTVGDALSGNGLTAARVSIQCERGAVDLIVHADADGRLDRARFVQPRDTPCVP